MFVVTKHFCCDKIKTIRDKYLSRQTQIFCRDKYTFVVTKDVFCHDKNMFVATKVVFRVKRSLSRQNFCCDKNLLVAAPANDTLVHHLEVKVT